MMARPFVAIVDDDVSVRASLAPLLDRLGFAVGAFASAEQFLASGAADDTDCLILDVAMPGMSGPALQHELSRQHRAIPIVIITAHDDEAVRSRVLAAGAVGFLSKPFTGTDLRDTVQAALRRA